MYLRRRLGPISGAILVGLLLAVPGPTPRAVDGVIEINQAVVSASGGFPFLINQPGSYVLTGNLTVGDPDAVALLITADHVTLDLNGFHVSGPAICTGTTGSISCTPGSGRAVESVARNVSVYRGTVTGFSAGGISLGDDATVDSVRVAENGGSGISVGMLSTVRQSRSTDNAGDGVVAGTDSVVSGNAASFNNGFGLDLGAGAAYEDNVINSNAGGTTNGGVALNDNICNSVACDCVPGPEVCDGLDNDCNGTIDDGFLNGGVYDTDQACGGCANDCTVVFPVPDGYGVCNATGSPVCELLCCTVGDPDPACSGTTDHFDLNGVPGDGCELTLDPAAIYVSSGDPGADDLPGCGLGPVGTGAGNRPCLSIARGLAEAVSTARSVVWVASGAYAEDVVLVDGIDLLGGHNAIDWSRDPSLNPSVIQGTAGSGHRKAVSAVGLATATRFDGFVVQGVPASTSSANSYAVYVTGSGSNLEVTNNVLYAGDGAPGVLGANGSDGAPGAPGSAGLPAGEFGNPTCAIVRSGGTRGVTTCGPTNVSGGDGGDAVCRPVFDTQTSGGNGSTGSNSGGSGGPGGWDGGTNAATSCSQCFQPLGGQPMAGAAGANGSDGLNGTGGTGCTVPGGSVGIGEWQGGSGGNAGNGAHGGGGGGGGAGGGGEDLDPATCFDDLGGTGGGGGAGGCAGTAGTGGSSGGGAFGIFIANTPSPPVVTGNTIYRGAGGAGGWGGAGGAGGIGGDGALGGPGANGQFDFCTGGGGAGGVGGDGGFGGGGGGGCGGVSWGVFASNYGGGSPGYDTNNSFPVSGTPGPGGAGGPSPGNSGTAGVAGDGGNASF